MFSSSFFSNEGIPKWMTAIVMIVLAVGYIYYKWTLHKAGKKENANIWSSNATISGIKASEAQNKLQSDETEE